MNRCKRSAEAYYIGKGVTERILALFETGKYITWAEIYMRLSRNNWDYVAAFDDLKTLDI